MSSHEVALRDRLSMTEEELLMAIAETQVSGLEMHSPQSMLQIAREFVGQCVSRVRPVLCKDGNLTSTPEWELAVAISSILRPDLESGLAVVVSAYLAKRGVAFICAGYEPEKGSDSDVN